MRSLTVQEARDRAALLRVTDMDVELDLDQGDQVFGSRTTIEFEARAADSTFVDVRPRTLREIVLDGEPLDPALLDEGRFALHLSAGTHRLSVDAEMAYSHDGEGLHRTVDPADAQPYLHLMSFLDSAPRCFGCFDQPDLKSRYRVRVTTPAAWTVVGNGRATRTEVSDSTARWELSETEPISSYLVTLVAGPYHSRNAEHDGIRLGVHVKQSLAAALDKDFDEIVEVTSGAFDAFHRMFGIRYPFGDYDQAFVPEFNAGAMENPGCVTFRDEFIFRGPVPDGERSGRARVIVHEMAHMWFGDLVTMQWWDDLWLNESFAEYMGHRVCDEATRFQDSWVDFTYVRKRWGLLADQRGSTHPVAGNGAADARTALTDFDGISYAKGAAVLKQLATYLGDEVFLAGVRDHLEQHAFGNATLADLLGAWERAAGGELDHWARGWLRQAGVDTLRVEDDALVLAPPAGAEPSGRPHGVTVQRIGPDDLVESESLAVAAERTALPLSPAEGHLLLPDAHDDTWAKVRLDAWTIAALPQRLPAVADPVTRGAAWLWVRDACDDAELSPAYALDLLAAALPTEDQDIALSSLSHWAGEHVLGRALGGDPVATARVAATLDDVVSAAHPGSGLQLAAARGLVAVSTDTDLLRRWLDGDAPAGVTLDADLRWRVLRQLCRYGAAGADEVDAEFDRDRSNEGEVHAARCRAALPDPAAKQAAWQVITRDAEVSNHVLSGSCDGFWWPEQTELVASYVPRYFVDVPATVSLRQGYVVAQTASEAYPRFAVDDATAEHAERLLGRDDIDAGVRRSVADRTDDLRKSIAVRRRWTG